MLMNVSYINMCKLNKNRKRRKEWEREREREREREVGGDGICGCSFGEPLAHETFQYSLFIYIETSA
jgi:pyruvate-formate lyase-activating enzyme